MHSATPIVMSLEASGFPAEEEGNVRNKILRIDASMRRSGSYSRKLADQLVHRLEQQGPTSLISRDLARGVGLVNEAWIQASATLRDDRTDEMRAILSESDALVSELRAADTVIIATPIYNFSIPSALKAWIDQVCRARETFRYTKDGPEGLLEGKRAFVIITSAGTELRSKIEFASDYLAHILGFIGITDVVLINAGQLGRDTEATLAKAIEDIEKMST